MQNIRNSVEICIYRTAAQRTRCYLKFSLLNEADPWAAIAWQTIIPYSFFFPFDGQTDHTRAWHINGKAETRVSRASKRRCTASGQDVKAQLYANGSPLDPSSRCHPASPDHQYRLIDHQPASELFFFSLAMIEEQEQS